MHFIYILLILNILELYFVEIMIPFLGFFDEYKVQMKSLIYNIL